MNGRWIIIDVDVEWYGMRTFLLFTLSYFVNATETELNDWFTYFITKAVLPVLFL